MQKNCTNFQLIAYLIAPKPPKGVGLQKYLTYFCLTKQF